MPKPNKPVPKRRTLEDREADLTQKLKKITLLKQIRANRDELNKLKTKK